MSLEGAPTNREPILQLPKDDAPAVLPHNVSPAWHATVAGGVSGFGSRMVTAPLDLIRIRRQLSVGVVYPSESLWQTWRTIVQQEGGVTALYRGNWAAIYLWIGYAATQFTVYSQVQEALLPWNPNALHATAVAFASGAVAGCCATLATYPFDVCRTAFVAHGTASSTSFNDTTCKGTKRAAPPPSTAAIRPSTSTPYGHVVERPFHHPQTMTTPTHPAVPPSLALVPEGSSSASSSSSSSSSSLRYLPRATTAMNSAAAVPSALPFSSLYEPCHTMVSHTVVPHPLPPPTTTTTTTTAPVKPLSQTPPARLTFRTLTVALYQQKGLAGFYAGAFPALIQIVPYMGLNFAIYDWLTTPTRTEPNNNNNNTNNSSSSVVGSAYAGSISGALSKLVVYPLDTVKRRLQAQALVLCTDGISSNNSNNNNYHQCYRGMWDCFVTIYRREGYAAFYRGMVPSVLKTTISTSLSFALYRWTRNALESGHG